MSVLHSLAAGYERRLAGRLVPSVAAVIGLISVATGGLAVNRSTRLGSPRAHAILALLAG